MDEEAAVQSNNEDPEAAAGGEGETFLPGAEEGTSTQEMAAELERCREEAARYLDHLARLQAEFDNYRKRQTREREEFQRSAGEGIIRDLLPILDNLERAAQHGGEETDPRRLLEGVTLVIKQFRETLGRLGVEEIAATGLPFDPLVHEAMSTVQTDGDPPEGTVVEEYRKGYRLKGRVLRAAMVSVAKVVDERSAGGG